MQPLRDMARVDSNTRRSRIAMRSMSTAKSEQTFAAGCDTSISRKMALPSLVMTMPAQQESSKVLCHYGSSTWHVCVFKIAIKHLHWHPGAS